MDNKAAVYAFSSDECGVRPGSWASRAAGWGRFGPSGVVGLFVPSASSAGVPCGQEVYSERLESWQRNLGLLFDSPAFAFPGLGPAGDRVWFVFCLPADEAAVNEMWDRFLLAVRQCRVLWSVSSIGIVGPGGYGEVG
jgi:hypothetical protein